jgi:hypothetical protein
MTDVGQPDDPRKRWWDAMKRAFDVPEGVSDENARMVIVGATIRDTGEFFDVDGTVAVTAMIDTILDLGSAGELDLLVAEEEPLYLNAASAAEDAAYNRAHDLGWRNTKDPMTLMKLREVSDRLISKAIDSEREGPPRSP